MHLTFGKAIWFAALACVVLMAGMGYVKYFTDMLEPAHSYVQLTQSLEPLLVGERDKARFVFPITNHSRNMIANVRVVDNSCGCQTVMVGATELAPGESTEIIMEAALEGGGSRHLACRVVGERGPDTGNTWACDAKVDVLPKVEWERKEVEFTNCESTSLYSKSLLLTLRRRPGEPVWQVQEPKARIKGLTLTVAEPVSAEIEELPGILKQEYKVIVSIRCPDDGGNEICTLNMRQGKEESALRLNVRWSLVKRLVIAPTQAFFVAAGVETPNAQAISLKRVDGLPLTILEAKSTNPAAMVAATKVDGQVAVLEIAVRPNVVPGFYYGTIEVETNYAAQRRAVIPVSVMVTKSSPSSSKRD